MADRIHVRVVSPERVVFEGDATSMVVPAWDGQVGILPGHAPLLALLGAGKLSVQRPDGGREAYHVAGGIVKVEGGAATVLTETAGPRPLASLRPGSVVLFEDVADEAARRDRP